MKHCRGKTGTIRRVIKQVSICLLLGAVVNVGVAWGFAWFTPGLSINNKYYSSNAVDNLDGAIHDVWEKYFPSARYQRRYMPQSYFKMGKSGLHYYMVIGFDRIHDELIALQLVRAGFPLNCMSYFYWTKSETLSSPLELVDARFAMLWLPPLSSEINNNRVVALPLRPLWPAFAINTIFYGVILWTLFAAPFAFRRWRRMKHGLCTKCGYDLRGEFESGCSECGWNRRDAE